MCSIWKKNSDHTISRQYYYYNTVNSKKENKSAQEWMGRLHIKAAEWNYKKHDRLIKDQFINGMNDEEIMQEIIKELTTYRNTS